MFDVRLGSLTPHNLDDFPWNTRVEGTGQLNADIVLI